MTHLMPKDCCGPAAGCAADALRAWLGSLPVDSPPEAVPLLTARLRTLARENHNLRTRLKLLELAGATADALLPLVEETLSRSSLPLAPERASLLAETNALLKELARAHGAIAREIAARWLGVGFAKPLRLTTLRGAQYSTRRLTLAYRVYALGARSAWQDLHGLHRIAREHGFAAEPVAGEKETVEQLYLRALLLALADPAHLAAGELDRVRFYLERHGHLATLQECGATLPGDPPPGLFLVQPDAPLPARSLAKWRHLTPRAGDLLVQCGPLVAKVQEHIGGLERSIVPARLGLPIVARHPQYLAMLRHLAQAWGAPPSRRHVRARFHPRAILSAGFAELWERLSAAVGRAAPREADGSNEWIVLNESPGGFAVRLLAGAAEGVKVGEVVGLELQDKPGVHVCLARRALSGRGGRLELGLEELCPQAAPATINAPDPRARGPGILQAVSVILLLRMPARRNAPALLAAPETVWPGIEFSVVNRGRHTRLRVARRLEKSGSFELFALERGG